MVQVLRGGCVHHAKHRMAASTDEIHNQTVEKLKEEKTQHSNRETDLLQQGHTYIYIKNAKRMAYPAPAPMDVVESGMHMWYYCSTCTKTATLQR